MSRRQQERRIRLTGHRSLFDRFAGTVTRYTGSPTAFIVAVLTVVVWACTGPFFGFSDTWQIVINTGTTIVTFLMVFLIQQSQNKDSLALHVKLNELLASHATASNRLVCIEDLDEDDLKTLRTFYTHLAKMAGKDGDIDETHSLTEAKQLHSAKHRQRAKTPTAEASKRGATVMSKATASSPASRQHPRKSKPGSNN